MPSIEARRGSAAPLPGGPSSSRSSRVTWSSEPTETRSMASRNAASPTSSRLRKRRRSNRGGSRLCLNAAGQTGWGSPPLHRPAAARTARSRDGRKTRPPRATAPDDRDRPATVAIGKGRRACSRGSCSRPRARPRGACAKQVRGERVGVGDLGRHVERDDQFRVLDQRDRPEIRTDPPAAPRPPRRSTSRGASRPARCSRRRLPGRRRVQVR